MDERRLVDAVGEAATPLRDDASLDPLMERIGAARVVLLGEASHGTREFYTWRDRVTRRLVREKGFRFVAVEGDWPDCFRVNRYVKGLPQSGRSARDVLHGFERWPTWMWANEEVVALAEWMREHNDGVEAARRVGFYGLDVYSLYDSMEAVIRYLDAVDPAAAARARDAYGCFDPYEGDVEEYAMATLVVPSSCEEEALRMLNELRAGRAGAGGDDPEAHFDAEQNALVAANAEKYYRAMIRGGGASWNVRDRHMTETLERLLRFHGPDAKAVVWEHNTHVGDARATDMARAGMVNVGQLARERWGGDVVIAGFSSHRGSVIAGRQWGAEMERMAVPAAREGSWEDVLHAACGGDRLLLTDAIDTAPGALEPRGHRAIGVVYHPARERQGNYVPTVLPYRYDAVLYVDESTALSPLHQRARRDGEPPETFPSGM